MGVLTIKEQSKSELTKSTGKQIIIKCAYMVSEPNKMSKECRYKEVNLITDWSSIKATSVMLPPTLTPV